MTYNECCAFLFYNTCDAAFVAKERRHDLPLNGARGVRPPALSSPFPSP